MFYLIMRFFSKNNNKKKYLPLPNGRMYSSLTNQYKCNFFPVAYS